MACRRTRHAMVDHNWCVHSLTVVSNLGAETASASPSPFTAFPRCPRPSPSPEMSTLKWAQPSHLCQAKIVALLPLLSLIPTRVHTDKPAVNAEDEGFIFDVLVVSVSPGDEDGIPVAGAERVLVELAVLPVALEESVEPARHVHDGRQVKPGRGCERNFEHIICFVSFRFVSCGFVSVRFITSAMAIVCALLVLFNLGVRSA